jgi:hypothetical protein
VTLHLQLAGRKQALEFSDLDVAVSAAWELFVDQLAHSMRITINGVEVMSEADILWRATVLGLD